jgi:hypothetical protein
LGSEEQAAKQLEVGAELEEEVVVEWVAAGAASVVAVVVESFRVYPVLRPLAGSAAVQAAYRLGHPHLPRLAVPAALEAVVPGRATRAILVVAVLGWAGLYSFIWERRL